MAPDRRNQQIARCDVQDKLTNSLSILQRCSAFSPITLSINCESWRWAACVIVEPRDGR